MRGILKPSWRRQENADTETERVWREEGLLPPGMGNLKLKSCDILRQRSGRGRLKHREAQTVRRTERQQDTWK